jgi:hypothetical protein
VIFFVATKKGRTKKFPPSSFGAVVGSGIDKNQYPEATFRKKTGINIAEQH